MAVLDIVFSYTSLLAEEATGATGNAVSDILFKTTQPVMEMPVGATGTRLSGVSLDGRNFNFPNTEVTTIFVY